MKILLILAKKLLKNRNEIFQMKTRVSLRYLVNDCSLRILNRDIDIHIKYAPNVIFACFALPNFCEKQKVSVDPVLVVRLETSL